MIYTYIICNMCNICTFAIIGYKSYATQQQLGSCTNEAHRLRDVDGSQRDAAVKGSRQEARDRGRQRHSQQRGTAGEGPATDDQNGVGDVHLGTLDVLIYVCMYVSMYLCIYVSIYIYMCIYI